MLQSAQTIEKLNKLKSYIMEEPSRFNMNYWGLAVDPKFIDKLDENSYEVDQEDDLQIVEVFQAQHPPCGTIGCIAGSICIMEGLIHPKEHMNGTRIYEFPHDTVTLAKKALGIDGDQADNLFFLSSWSIRFNKSHPVGWPFEFEHRLSTTTPGTKEYAQVTCDRIDYFIATGE